MGTLGGVTFKVGGIAFNMPESGFAALSGSRFGSCGI